MSKPRTILVRVLTQERARLFRLANHLRVKTGKPHGNADVLKLALDLLAKQEGIQ